MKLFPAIDLRGGKCVRLYQGDYDRQTVYGDDPSAQAEAFVAEGAEVVHVVDLDAALTGEPVNRRVIARICRHLSVPVQVGGGVRTREAADALFAAGVHRVVIGTAALEKPQLVADVVASGGRVAVGLDARGDEVATHGWTERTGRTVTELADQFADTGVEALVVTEISRDGTLEGPDETGLCALLAATSIPVVASGGVGSLDHLRSLAAVRVRDADGVERRFEGAIVGRALYENNFTVSEARRAIAEVIVAGGEETP
ncbi:MAG: 1-(5-phosphoribosyl)-5-[(5-phosphoribosylamino)methylideneamino]imidazole-4-carboxamide isomerase [Acidimicrobiia bacterium]|nr:1-(5-phosphoribosyl)-5-[(5-phosphoribosylamino)methylideneamino]imidazole-4-carboxamide isomerase [Acidimicrobiia bacterium]